MFLAVVAVALVVAATISLVGLRSGRLTWHFSQLLFYQLEKLERAAPVDVVLLGDSSLGNAVDAAAWARETGRGVASLALTGAYGYGGSLNMLRRALRRHPVRSVVLFHTMDMPIRPPAHEGVALTAETLADLLPAPPTALWSTAVNLAMPLNVLRTTAGARPAREDYAGVDYVPQTVAPSAQGAAEPRPAPFVPVAAAALVDGRYLREIARTCAMHRLTCVYVVGPMTESRCRDSDAYQAVVRRHVEATGLRVVAEAICMPWADTGDAHDHVLPARKAEYSRRYLARVRPYLDPGR